MRRLVAISLASLLLLASGTWVLFHHHCNIQDTHQIALSESLECCEMELEPVSCCQAEAKACQMGAEESIPISDPCCEHEQLVIEPVASEIFLPLQDLRLDLHFFDLPNDWFDTKVGGRELKRYGSSNLIRYKPPLLRPAYGKRMASTGVMLC